MEEQNEITLADLAGFDVSDIQEMRNESLPGGAYEFEIIEAGLTEGANRETNAKQFEARFKLRVVQCLACLERGVDRESLVNRTHTERRYIVPGEKAAEGIGYIRGFIADMGLPNAGPLGGDGQTQGIIDGTVGHIFKAKIVKQADKHDKTRFYSRLVLDPAKR